MHVIMLDSCVKGHILYVWVWIYGVTSGDSLMVFTGILKPQKVVSGFKKDYFSKGVYLFINEDCEDFCYIDLFL